MVSKEEPARTASSSSITERFVVVISWIQKPFRKRMISRISGFKKAPPSPCRGNLPAIGEIGLHRFQYRKLQMPRRAVPRDSVRAHPAGEIAETCHLDIHGRRPESSPLGPFLRVLPHGFPVLSFYIHTRTFHPAPSLLLPCMLSGRLVIRRDIELFLSFHFQHF